MSKPSNIVRLVCGCPDRPQPDHERGCQLGLAEQIAQEAADVAAAVGGHRLLTALNALGEAGLLRDLETDDPTGCLLGILDALWEAGVLQPAAPPAAASTSDDLHRSGEVADLHRSTEVEPAEAASTLDDRPANTKAPIESGPMDRLAEVPRTPR